MMGRRRAGGGWEGGREMMEIIRYNIISKEICGRIGQIRIYEYTFSLSIQGTRLTEGFAEAVHEEPFVMSPMTFAPVFFQFSGP